MKVKRWTGSNGEVGYSFRCPGCAEVRYEVHSIRTEGEGAKWGFNGDLERPTFTPSIFVKTVHITEQNRDAYDALATPAEISASVEDPRFRWWCHSFVTEGRIQFLGDCSHALAGQTVDLPDWNRATLRAAFTPISMQGTIQMTAATLAAAVVDQTFPAGTTDTAFQYIVSGTLADGTTPVSVTQDTGSFDLQPGTYTGVVSKTVAGSVFASQPSAPLTIAVPTTVTLSVPDGSQAARLTQDAAP